MINKDKHRARIAKYIGDLVYGANDGIITTFAIVAGVAGAELAPKVVIILGFSNLIADGFSMATSNYLARQSEKQYKENVENQDTENEKPIKNAIATFVAFVVAGAVPLIPYLFSGQKVFVSAIIATSIALFTIGSLRALITKTRWYVAGFEMLLVGASAALVAYYIGDILSSLVK